MTENATILISDISGYTEFLTKTALVHSSHIINELLDLIIVSNTLDFTLSEIEGDAVLFYHKGKPIAVDSLIRQCLTTFENFHKQLKIIERDTVCLCGACQTASDLSLKFIVHYGPIKEIKVSRFTKAAGLDMIIAHRLLKNRIGAPEYILTTRNYLNHLSDRELPFMLTWQQASDEYTALGIIEYHYTLLEQYKNTIPDPPKRESLVIELGEDSLEIEINTSLLDVYQKLIDLDGRVQWIPGLEIRERDEVTERIGQRHVCLFGGTTTDVITVSSDIRDDHITYIEDGRTRGPDILYRETYLLKSLKEGKTVLTFNVKWLSDPEPPEKFVRQYLDFYKLTLERFKQFCENQLL